MTARTRQRKGSSAASTNPVDIAMDAVASGKAPDDAARRLIVQQERLIRWQTASEKAAFTLRLLTGAAGLVAAAALGWMVWSATQANGVIVESFSVPPALVQRGLTGEVLAAQVMDHLSRMSRIAQSAQAERRVGNGWNTGISVEIPNTGVSLGQIDQWLRDKLGHETRVAGELVIGADGRLALTARSGAVGLPTILGAEAELPLMIERTAEQIYKTEQPNSYSQYLGRQGAARRADHLALTREMIASPDRTKQVRGHTAMGGILRDAASLRAARESFRRAVEIDEHEAGPAISNLSQIETILGHPEEAYRLRLRYVPVVENSDYYGPEAKRQRRISAGVSIASFVGDYNRANALDDAFRKLTLLGYVDVIPVSDPLFRTNLHDLGEAKRRLARLELKNGNYYSRAVTLAEADEDWPALLSAADAFSAFQQTTTPDKGVDNPQGRLYRALAMAKLGRIEEARAAIDETGLDCQPCVLVRGEIAETAGDHRLADHWFGQAVKMAPSLPQANHQWGRILLRRGDAAGALAKAKAANMLGPKWGDPLVLWGEALLARGDERGAVAKFRAADRLAPLWGRLHLVWGEALAKQGKVEDAKAQWKIAAKLDLTAAERARLATLTVK